MSDDSGVLRNTLIKFSLEENNVVTTLNAINGAGDSALRTMTALDSAIGKAPQPMAAQARELAGLTETWEQYNARTGGIISKIPSRTEQLTAMTGAFTSMGYSVHNAMSLMDRYEISAMSTENATLALEDAQARYNEAVKKHGANSEEATKAANMLTRAQNNLDKANIRATGSMAMMALQGISMVPNFLNAGQALVTFAMTGKLAAVGLTGLTWAQNMNTISTAANSTATGALTAAKTFLTAATSRDTYIRIANTAAMAAGTIVTWGATAAMSALAVATWSVAIPILAIEAPLWLVVAAGLALVLVIQDLYTLFTGGDSVIGGFLKSIMGLPDLIGSVLKGDFGDAGKMLIDTFLASMTFGLLNTDRLEKVFGVIGDYLPHSNAKVGPLSDLTGAGMKFTETFAKGAQLGVPSIGAPLSGIKDSLLSGGGGGGGTSIIINITGNTISGDDASLGKLAGMTRDAVEETINRILSNQARRAGI